MGTCGTAESRIYRRWGASFPLEADAVVRNRALFQEQVVRRDDCRVDGWYCSAVHDEVPAIVRVVLVVDDGRDILQVREAVDDVLPVHRGVGRACRRLRRDRGVFDRSRRGAKVDRGGRVAGRRAGICGRLSVATKLVVAFTGTSGRRRTTDEQHGRNGQQSRKTQHGNSSSDRATIRNGLYTFFGAAFAPQIVVV